MMGTAERWTARRVAGIVLLSLSTICGCESRGRPKIASPVVDAEFSAAEAMRQYDKNSDGQLSAAESESCPIFASSLEAFDANGDGQIGEQEIADHLERLFDGKAGLTNVICLVTHGGKPLAEASVEFVPESFLGDAVQGASGNTDSSGQASPSISADKLPDELRSLRAMQPGLYRVKITHPSLAEGHRLLGFEVDPTRRDGTTARFDL